jgi:hypothetical protein
VRQLSWAIEALPVRRDEGGAPSVVEQQAGGALPTATANSPQLGGAHRRQPAVVDTSPRSKSRADE